MPKIGKVVYRHNKFFAFGFLRGCEQGLGMIESLIGNPIISRGARNKAVDMIMEALIDEADKKGMKSLLGLTIIPSLEKKVIETYGFKKHSCSILVLNRGEGS